MKLEISNQFNLEVIKNLYRNKDDLSLAFPSASFPIVFNEWKEWIERDESENFSLVHFSNKIAISHVSIKSYKKKPGIVYLCFFIIDPDHRGKGLSKVILRDIYRFVFNHLKKKELWLVVDPSNKKAFNLYIKEGFKVFDERPAGMRMKKDLRKVGSIT